MAKVDPLVDPHIANAVDTLTDNAFDEKKRTGHYIIIVKATVTDTGATMYSWEWYARRLDT